ncbi:GNAT family N-acetyltransferase [Streptomyces gobiensis]|uniref:GNAT family N-acetyltransferase n=1 Tax=Streptomyces gobiensis TaxID=2875706 RepID=UPI001E3DDAEB|nr:GNAT family N-acetyltransferase [Streptomyces gobiensis]UGY90420.1 GNAT family N-acetyltransferase [Streptomyces gobiensis]
MTTTLRPSGPELRATDGARSRTYDVCVNSRPVGSVRLATDASPASGVGRIEGLTIAVPDRRWGRATVAALAAEEVLRGWGCGQIMLAIPADAEAALHLATALGYTERGRTLAKKLTTPPQLPIGSAARPMDSTEFTVWQATAKATYAQSWMNLGLPRAAAEEKSGTDHRRMLPDGAATRAAILRILAHQGTDVGTLWAGLRLPDHTDGCDGAGGCDGYVYDMQVTEEHRGRGHGRALMHLAEQECLAAGARVLGLTVFAGNTPARRLYTSLGYRTTTRHLRKPLL